MARNNTWLLIALVALLIVFGLCAIWKKPAEKFTEDEPIRYDSVDNVDDIDFVGDADDIELIEADDQPAFEIGFGMGPGIYGSGRATSEMLG